MLLKDQKMMNVDSAEKFCLPEPPVQSANTLFRFFTELDYLLGCIEKSALVPRYYIETVDYLEINRAHIAYPMICFCDINLHKMASHIAFYGQYGIAFSKEWGIRKGVQPIQYVNPYSYLRKDFSEAFKHAISAENEDVTHDFLLTKMYYLKPITGTMQRDGKEQNRIFTDECEWRYIPDLRELELPQAVDEDEIFSLDVWNEAIEEHQQAWLTFEYQDIKYLIVNSENDFEKLCEIVQRKVSDSDIRNRLIAKVIIWEDEGSDF